MDLEILIDKMEISESGLALKETDKLKFHYDKYNPTRGGLFIELPDWIKKNKTCINIQNEDDKCLNMLFNVEYTRLMKKPTHVNLTMTKNIDDY